MSVETTKCGGERTILKLRDYVLIIEKSGGDTIINIGNVFPNFISGSTDNVSKVPDESVIPEKNPEEQTTIFPQAAQPISFDMDIELPVQAAPPVLDKLISNYQSPPINDLTKSQSNMVFDDNDDQTEEEDESDSEDEESNDDKKSRKSKKAHGRTKKHKKEASKKDKKDKKKKKKDKKEKSTHKSSKKSKSEKLEKNKEKNKSKIKKYRGSPKPVPTRVFPTVKESNNKFIKVSHVQELIANGFTIVEDVLSQQEIVKAYELATKFISDIGSDSGITENSFYSNIEKFKYTFDAPHGIVQYPPTGHIPFALYVRSTKSVSTVFSELWGCEASELITSYERVQIGLQTNEVWKKKFPIKNFTPSSNTNSNSSNSFLPGTDDISVSSDDEDTIILDDPKDTDKKSSKVRKVPTWIHSAQNPKLKGLQSVQGYVTITDVGSNGGAFMALKGSHKYHNQIISKITEMGLIKKETTSVQLPSKLDNYLINTKKCEPVCVRPLKAGSMVLWDSRLFCANILPGNVGIPESYTCTIKSLTPSMTYLQNSPSYVVPSIGAYVSMVPRIWVNDAPRSQIEKKRKAFLEGRSTTSSSTNISLLVEKPIQKKNQKIIIQDKNYIDPKQRLKNAHQFLKETFPTRMNEIARQNGFHDVHAFQTAVESKMHEKNE